MQKKKNKNAKRSKNSSWNTKRMKMENQLQAILLNQAMALKVQFVKKLANTSWLMN